MRAIHFLTGLLVLGAPAAFGQAGPPVADTASLRTARYSASDTMRALRHLFQHRWKGAVGYTAFGGATLADAAVTTALRPAGTPEGQQVDTNQDWLAGSLALGYGVLRWRRFGPQHYQTVITAYEQGQPLPSYVRRRLKPRYFRYRSF